MKDLKGDEMGFVVAKIKIMPKDMEVFEELKADLKPQVEVMEEELIAFGMKALLVLFKMDDEGGAQELATRSGLPGFVPGGPRPVACG